jgi:hypothetical protein
MTRLREMTNFRKCKRIRESVYCSPINLRLLDLEHDQSNPEMPVNRSSFVDSELPVVEHGQQRLCLGTLG